MVYEGDFSRMFRTDVDNTIIVQDKATEKCLAIAIQDLTWFVEALGPKRPAMEIVKPYENLREMTPEVLLQLTQSHKYQEVKRSFPQDIGLSSRLVITQEDIENMGETLKMLVFFVSPAIIREAVLLAKEKSVLGVESDWLKETTA